MDKENQVVVVYRFKAYELPAVYLYSNITEAIIGTASMLNEDYGFDLKNLDDIRREEQSSEWAVDMFEVDEKKTNTRSELRQIY